VQRLKQEEEYRNEKRVKRDLVAASIKSGYNPGSLSFIDIMRIGFIFSRTITSKIFGKQRATAVLTS
jgi:hypothetical protein